MTLNSNYYNPIFKKYSVNKLSLASWGLSTLHAPQNCAEHLLTTDKTSPAARPGLLPPSCTLSSDFSPLAAAERRGDVTYTCELLLQFPLPPGELLPYPL